MSDTIKSFNERVAGGKGDATIIMPAATVVLLRETEQGPETLMLRKNSKIAFGGMWVFPGGRVDEEDTVANADGQLDELTTAAAAGATWFDVPQMLAAKGKKATKKKAEPKKKTNSK